MENGFHISCYLRTVQGFEKFARFELGTDRTFAYALFSELEGSTDTKETDTLTMELVESQKGLPLNLKIISCTLDQLSINCRHLTKEIFKKRTLGL
jgi:hypothetical protein